MPEKPSYVALRVSRVYAVVAGLWILLSDVVASRLFSDPATRMAVETYKGLAFVTVTAVLLYLTVRGDWRRDGEDVYSCSEG